MEIAAGFIIHKFSKFSEFSILEMNFYTLRQGNWFDSLIAYRADHKTKKKLAHRK